MPKKVWRKPEVKTLKAGAAEAPAKSGAPVDGSGHTS